ncbi:hypothetical protein O181_043302 [Austropuccinia psidii MF-1]|uniref:Uncharacterized protein n=1 Tax=Austropuccinia psidii MF-1 TaxID=1389203 RepID=A0A9Q3DK99_9BASI|nr:hypothetical protein [Austropuccinia psidii MF-1]
MASDEIYESSPLVHKEKVTGSHHPYYSKPRTGHASSSIEKFVDDEDENVSPTQSETTGEPRRDDLIVYEECTWENSEFTHPQMPLSQCMLNQSEMRQQRKKAHKAPNVATHASQKEKQRLLKVELPYDVHGMRSVVNTHCLFLLKVKDKYFSSLLAQLRAGENESAIHLAGHLGYVPKDVFNEPSTKVKSQGF